MGDIYSQYPRKFPYRIILCVVGRTKDCIRLFTEREKQAPSKNLSGQEQRRDREIDNQPRYVHERRDERRRGRGRVESALFQDKRNHRARQPMRKQKGSVVA